MSPYGTTTLLFKMVIVEIILEKALVADASKIDDPTTAVLEQRQEKREELSRQSTPDN